MFDPNVEPVMAMTATPVVLGAALLQ